MAHTLHSGTISVIDPRTDSDWDRSLASFPTLSVFHSQGWASALLATYPFRPFYLTASRDGEIQGVLPLMEIDSPFTGRRGVSLPFTDDCEILAKDPEMSAQLATAAREMACERKWKYLELRQRATQAESQTVPSPLFHSHQMALGTDTVALFKLVSDSTRRAVRKAEKSGVHAEVRTDLPSMRQYYRLHCLARKGHGLPPQSWGFFAAVHRHLIATGRGYLVLATHANQVIAGAVYLTCGSRVTYKFGASDVRHLSVRPNHLVMWTAIQHAASRGYAQFDFGRTSLWNEGLRFYKSRWGTREENLYYSRFDPSTGDTTSAHDGAGGIKTRIFQRLPIWSSRLIGTLLYRHVA